jgi:hypothetical protein
MGIKQQQTIAGAALRLIRQEIDPEAMIMGGAPRDWTYGQLAKDIDIFTRALTNESADSIKNRIADALFTDEKYIYDLTSGSPYLANKDNGVLFVFEVRTLLLPVQIIVCDREPVKMLDTFDLSICKVYASKGKDFNSVEIYTTEVFDLSKRYNICLASKTSEDRIYRIREKFPTMTVIHDPEQI